MAPYQSSRHCRCRGRSLVRPLRRCVVTCASVAMSCIIRAGAMCFLSPPLPAVVLAATVHNAVVANVRFRVCVCVGGGGVDGLAVQCVGTVVASSASRWRRVPLTVPSVFSLVQPATPVAPRQVSGWCVAAKARVCRRRERACALRATLDPAVMSVVLATSRRRLVRVRSCLERCPAAATVSRTATSWEPTVADGAHRAQSRHLVVGCQYMLAL